MRKPGTEVPGKGSGESRVARGRHGFSPSLSEPVHVRAHIVAHFPFPMIFPRKTVIDALGSTNVV